MRYPFPLVALQASDWPPGQILAGLVFIAAPWLIQRQVNRDLVARGRPSFKYGPLSILFNLIFVVGGAVAVLMGLVGLFQSN